MEMYVSLLEVAIKNARKCYILEPTREGKLIWLETLTKFKKELYQLKTADTQ
jgi:hypothetical protein